MPIATSYIVDNDKLFDQAIRRALKVTDDLRVPFRQISQDFYKSEKSIFQNKGPGQYDDLSPKYKKRKKKKWGFVYPILKASGALEASVTGPKNKGSINTIRKKELFIGTRVESEGKKPYAYPIAHQLGLGKNPVRKFLFIGPEAGQFATRATQGRAERWFNILNSFVLQKMKQQGFEVGGVASPPKNFEIKEGQS